MELPDLPQLTLDGTDTRLQIDSNEIQRFYIPLATYLHQRSAGSPRSIIGIAGPPGCGKTAFTTLLAAVMNARANHEEAVSVGLDGWHFPNDFLDTNSTTRAGQSIRLRQVKGAPETYDLASALDFVRAARQGKLLAYPVYSRSLHEPVHSGGMLTSQHRFVLMEGNYLLLDMPGWDQFRLLFDTTIFITAPREELSAALRTRHLRGGKTIEAVDEHLAFSDLPNLDLILSHSALADIRVEKIDSRRIAKVIYPIIG